VIIESLMVIGVGIWIMFWPFQRSGEARRTKTSPAPRWCGILACADGGHVTASPSA